MLIVVIDSNVLLQCKPFHELPWNELGDDLRVVVPHACIKEIDRLKGDGNTRRANRARQAASMFAQALESDLVASPLGEKLSGTWELGSGRVVAHDLLDTSQNDDRLIAEALALKAATSDRVLIFSGDTIVRMKARNVNLDFKNIPDGWLLPRERNENEKKVAALEKRVNALESTSPTFSVQLRTGSHSEPSASIQHPMQQCRNLTSSDVEELVEQAKRRYPMASDAVTEVPFLVQLRASQNTGRIVHPRPGEFELYQSVSYPKWVHDVRCWIDAYIQRLNTRLRVVRFSFDLKNTGARPADGLILEYRVTRGALLLPPADDARAILARPKFPAPPKVPQPTFVASNEFSIPAPYFPNLDVTGARSNRDPYSFYWKSTPDDLIDRHIFECQEFRHGYTEEFSVGILLPAAADPGNMTMLVRATARNLPKPWEAHVPIHYTIASHDPMAELKIRINPPKNEKKREPTVTLRVGTGDQSIETTDPDS